MSVTGGRRGGLLLAAVAAVGILVLVLALKGQDPDPPPAPDDTGSLDATRDPGSASPDGSPGSSTPGKAAEEKDPPLGPSTPITLTVPKIGVDSEVITVGTADDGTLEVPQPGPDLDKAAWFDKSPTPGQPGPSIIEGHVSTEEGASVFLDLGRLRPGDKVTVDREDGTRATFTVYALRTFDKDRFPTKLVYGGDLSTPTLRLITCSNFDPNVGHHTGNLVVFSKLTAVHDG
ncbi:MULTISPECIES: class F sortase [unclassified Nocardioides]|uniref:class F sortase n=1 Tax=unclassified Nocardioides TaxID=2615069 RepID=UPI0007023057|nr:MULTISPECIES: class F sortase [unclassified Nocardioides]KQY56646.1 hypothetical protein ASD30_10005 [Nocardioides sp. Root140]KRF14479.1 hypothetical protein ASH02_09110 [Nocardioides sp. Soil796]